MSKIISSIFVFLFCISPSFADESKEVRNFVNTLGNKIIAVASDNGLKVNQRRDRLTDIINEVVDTNWISKFVLGKHYRVATDSQKEKFRKLYHDFMVNTYGPKFNGYNGEKFTITSVINDNNYYTAKCIFYPKNGEPDINIDFRVRKNTTSNKPQFLIFDVVAEGVSLIETQRSEFGTVISKDGLDNFMVDLQERIKKLKNEAVQPQSAKISSVKKK
jgi:phospholipid transport system substrate-binding protein